MNLKENVLLNHIKYEYLNRIKSGKSKEASVLFNNELFIDKYHYNANDLDYLLNNLSLMGYIDKWIIDGFELIDIIED